MQKNPVENLMEEAVQNTIPDVQQSPEQALLPSTPEAQQETAKHKEFNDRIRKKQAQVASQSREGIKQISEQEAQKLVLEEMKAEQAAQEEKAKLEEQQQLQQLQQMDSVLEEYRQNKQYALSQGIPFKEDLALEKTLKEKEEAANLARPATPVDVEIARTPSVGEVKEQESEIRKQNALDAAKEELHREKIQTQQAKQKALEEEIKREDESLKSMGSKGFWNKLSTGDKILASIGIALSGIGSGLTNQPNMAMQMINKYIDDDMEAQKLSLQEKQAKRQEALRRVDQDLKRLQLNTDNELKKAKIMQLKNQVSQAHDAELRNRLQSKKLSSSEGLTREEVFALDPKMQEKMVLLSDGRFRPAMNEQIAKKLNQETIPQSKDAIRGLNRLQEILEKPAAEINPVLRAEAATIKQSLKGALRLELFGPGVMTDFESKMADKIIGDPTKILTFDAAEKAKFQALLNKVQQGTRDKIRQAGVAIPESKNEKMLNQFMSKNPGIKRPEAINALIKLKYWDPNEQAF